MLETKIIKLNFHTIHSKYLVIGNNKKIGLANSVNFANIKLTFPCGLMETEALKKQLFLTEVKYILA